MDNIKEVRRRMNVQQIREFLLDGTDRDTKNQPTVERLADMQRELGKYLKSNVQGEKTRYHIESLIYKLLDECENVFFEQGMQAGARILLGMLGLEKFSE